MNHSLSLWRHTAIVCACLTFLLGGDSAVANAVEVNMAIPISEKPVPFTQEECNQLASAAEEVELASLQCGGDAEIYVLLFLLFIIAMAAAKSMDAAATNQ